MIAIRASEGEVEISGTVGDLLEVGLTIRALAASSQFAVLVPAAPCSPAPYERSVARLAVRRRPGPTVVSLAASELEVSGSDTSLNLFASWFEFPAGVGEGYHNHFEPLEGDPDHSPASVSLVVTVCLAGA